ncbi:MAG: hypothetical protein KJ941_01445 [Bacteroidetes bacterium]|nr:hypothetical protein [Bacteroidota bacterium]
MKYLFVLITFFGGLNLMAQSNQDTLENQKIYQDITARQTKIARVGLTALSTWAVGNMVVGGIGMSNTSGKRRSFHEMNFYFNTVNLVLGGLGVLSTYQPRKSDFKSLIDYSHSIEKVYLFNIALDLGYIASGWAIYNKGLSQKGEKADRSFGYGKSLYLQGGFLFVYDLVMFNLNHRQFKKLNDNWPNLQVGFTGNGVRLNYSFQ